MEDWFTIFNRRLPDWKKKEGFGRGRASLNLAHFNFISDLGIK